MDDTPVPTDETASTSRTLARLVRVGYLGPESTFTHRAAEVAARRHFGPNVGYLAARRVDEVFSMTERGLCDFGVVPIENSTEGSVRPTLDLLAESRVKICAEVIVPIVQHLMGRGALESVRQIYSHPQALAQCHRWLEANRASKPWMPTRPLLPWSVRRRTRMRPRSEASERPSSLAFLYSRKPFKTTLTTERASLCYRARSLGRAATTGRRC